MWFTTIHRRICYDLGPDNEDVIDLAVNKALLWIGRPGNLSVLILICLLASTVNMAILVFCDEIVSRIIFYFFLLLICLCFCIYRSYVDLARKNHLALSRVVALLSHTHDMHLMFSLVQQVDEILILISDEEKYYIFGSEYQKFLSLRNSS